VSRTLRRVQFLRHEWCLTMNVILFLLKRWVYKTKDDSKRIFQDCLEFYGLLPYHQGLKSAIRGSNILDPKSWKEKISFTLQFPYFSHTAKVYAIFDILVIVIRSVKTFLEIKGIYWPYELSLWQYCPD
jgi:hypothetical protein